MLAAGHRPIGGRHPGDEPIAGRQIRIDGSQIRGGDAYLLCLGDSPTALAQEHKHSASAGQNMARIFRNSN